MHYKDYEIVVSSHLGSIEEDGHTVFAHQDRAFFRAQSQFGVVYANSELSAVQGAIDIIDSALNKLYPV